MENKVINESKIICVFCNAIQPLEVEIEIDNISGGCTTCGNGAKAKGRAEVKCRTCGKVIYIKEFEEFED